MRPSRATVPSRAARGHLLRLRLRLPAASGPRLSPPPLRHSSAKAMLPDRQDPRRHFRQLTDRVGPGAGPSKGSEGERRARQAGPARTRAPVGTRAGGAGAEARPSQDGGGHARPGAVCAQRAAAARPGSRRGGCAGRPSASLCGCYLLLSRLAPTPDLPVGPGAAGQQRPGLPDQAVDSRERPGHGRAHLLEPGEGLGAPASGPVGADSRGFGRASEASPRCALPGSG